MSEGDYWRICAEEALEDAKIDATNEQIDIVASWMESGAENKHEAMGYDIADANLKGEEKRRLEKAEAELERERNKVWCAHCNGTGQEVSHGPYHSAYSECYKCRGHGRHDP